ncbi:uncharacterized protein LOC120358753 [Solenopsis invicta]|uniref:uncharacterized protein LOC120358753 n=1 Tax=Solenopsis invicta TaxID=13686 RepID=UPI00193DC009|nr:uncharacterized protein LOC120358753 [Solenopsis invicta]
MSRNRTTLPRTKETRKDGAAESQDTVAHNDSQGYATLGYMCNDCNTIVNIGEEHECNIGNNNVYDDYNERLIAEVFVREGLWNSKLPYKFRGPAHLKTLWCEVDTCLGTPAGSSQIKWKSLRDRFVREHSSVTTYIPSGSGAMKKKSNWPLYDTLRFLIPTVNYRKTISNLENINPDFQSESDTQLSLSDESSLAGTSNNNTYIRKKINIAQQVQTKRSLLKPQTALQQNCFNAEISQTAKESLRSPQPSKYRKKQKVTENVDMHLEEVLLKELKHTIQVM